MKATKITINGVEYDLQASSAAFHFGTNSSSAGTNVRPCTVEPFQTENGKPLVGTAIAVRFDNPCQSTEAAQLNVNGTGNTPIWADGAVVTGERNYYAGHVEGGVIYYVYDGTYWVFAGFDGNVVGTSLEWIDF